MEKFDVFLSHNSVDKPWVIHLKDSLIQYGLSVWLDKDEIRPGDLFAKALEDGLENCQAVALVVSPESMASGWVEEEYYRALSLSKNKKIKLQLIPIILRSSSLPGFVQSRNYISFENSSSYAENVWNLVWGITGIKPQKILAISPNTEVVKGVLHKAPLYNVPKLPPHFINRSEHIDKIKGLLLQDTGKNVGITGISHAVGLQGMGGIGKSILASSIAYDKEIRDFFYDGIIWITVGQNPEIVDLQSNILNYFNQSGIILENPEHGKSVLSKLLQDKKVLIILDDIWKINDVQHFEISSTETKTLITTRHSQVLRGISAEEYKIDVMSSEQAMQLLRIQSKWEKDEMPDEAKVIVEECGALPLAISMIGAMLKYRPLSRWQQALKHLRNAELKNIRQQFSNYPYPDLFVALHVSVESQPSIIQKLYLELAVFPQDIPIPESVLEIYWNKEDLQHYGALEVIDELLDASLIFRYDENNIILHDLQNDYIRSQCRDIKACHNEIIDSYKRAYPLGWYIIPESSKYFHSKIIYHLERTGNSEKIKTIIGQLLSGKNFLSWSNILICGQLINKPLVELAQQVIKTSQDSNTLCGCLKVLKKEAKEDARRLIKIENQNKDVIATCLNLLGVEAKEDARRLIKIENQNKDVIAVCLNLLGVEAKGDARRLIKIENQYPDIISVCLNLLGIEAKEDARRLIKIENQNPDVISVCLNLLGIEAKEDARRLIKIENQNPQVINVCLNLLGIEAKENARQFIKIENQNPQVIRVCLNLLGVEAKEDARRLIKTENQNKDVIAVCLNLLGVEAKEDARRLIKVENQSPQVINVCLNLLGIEAKEDAQRLIKIENQNPQVINVCLNLLGIEAKENARQLIKIENQNKDVIKVCLNLLGVEAKEDARRLIKIENQNIEVIIVCLEILGAEVSELISNQLRSSQWKRLDSYLKMKVLGIPIMDKNREQRALEVLSNWKLHFRPLVSVALTVFDEKPTKVLNVCTEILQNWDKDYKYYGKKRISKYSGYIRKAMSHPKLSHLSKLVAMAIINTETETPGFADEELFKHAQLVIKGTKFEWTDPI